MGNVHERNELIDALSTDKSVRNVTMLTVIIGGTRIENIYGVSITPDEL